jgi:hypothetical protein
MSDVIDETVEETVDTTAEQVAEAPVEEAAPEASAPAFDPREMQAEIEHLREQNAQIVAWAQSQGATREQAQTIANEQTGDLDEIDLFADDAGAKLKQLFEQRDKQLLGAIDQRLERVFQPIEQAQHAQVVAEGEQQMRDVIADEFSRNGDLLFGGDDIVNKIIDDVRNRYFPEVAERYGQTNRAAEIAISRAVEAERAYQKQIGDAAVTAHENRKATLAGQRGEPTGSIDGVLTSSDEILPEGGVARKWAANAARLRNT